VSVCAIVYVLIIEFVSGPAGMDEGSFLFKIRAIVRYRDYGNTVVVVCTWNRT
jgi:hypothetical protein